MIVTLDHGRVRELRLARPPANALNPELMRALRVALADARADACEGIVISGAPGRFSGGLDVPELLTLRRDGMRDAWQTLFGLLQDIADSDVPIATALTGHSPAGGTVIALFSDYRVFADGPFVMGLNEVQVGIPLPEPIFRALVLVVGARQAERLAVGGLLVGPAEALRCGVVDEVVPVDEVIPRAIAWTTELLTRPRVAMSSTRKMARKALRDVFAWITPENVDTVVDQWFSVETQTVMKALAAKLGKRS